MQPRLSPARFLLAAVVAAAFVLSAPFIGQIRSQLRRSFPDQFVWIVGSAVAVLVAAGIVAALLRIRQRRAVRYFGLALALAGAAAFARWHATGRADTDVVELFHFVEYGIITFLFYRASKPAGDLSILLLPVLAGLLVGTCEEWLQWFIPNRVGEWADVFLNLVAIACGLLFSVAADPPAALAPSLPPPSRLRVARVAAVVVFVFALFFYVVHLGSDIVDPEIGTFDTRYSPSRLAELATEKREEWRVTPLPLELRRISREDQYMTEGVQHVQERNEAWAKGDVASAWRENQILEKYYAPVLDTPSYVSKTGHRWPPEQRADAAARASGAPTSAAYVSQAYPYRLYKWNATLYWAIVGLAVGVLIGGVIPYRHVRAAPDAHPPAR